MKELQKYQCEICGKIFDTKEECQACESEKIGTPKYKIGDIVNTEYTSGEIIDVKNDGHKIRYMIDDNPIEFSSFYEDEILGIKMSQVDLLIREQAIKTLEQIIKQFNDVNRNKFPFNIFVKKYIRKNGNMSIEVNIL